MKSVDDIILNLPKPERIIVERLRSLIVECIPKAEEKNSYGVPFYRHNRMICFVWPPSIFWGPKRTEKSQQEIGVALGFCQGSLMSNELGLLKAEKRKQVYCMYLHSLMDLDEIQIKALLFEAALIDEGFKKK